MSRSRMMSVATPKPRSGLSNGRQHSQATLGRARGQRWFSLPRSGGTMISRRAVLKGILGGSPVFLGLPILEQMLNNNGTALAAGTALPQRYGLFFWGNGVPWSWRHRGTTDTVSPGITHDLADTLTDFYTPTTQGKGWVVPDTLKPLANHVANINVVTGLEPKTNIPATPIGQSDGHMRGITVALTADQIQPAGFDHDPHIFAVSRATLDQYIAKHPQFYTDGAPQFRSP